MNDVNDDKPCCAHVLVDLKPIDHPDGTRSDSWVCRDCGKKFWPEVMKIEPAATKPMSNLTKAIIIGLGTLGGLVFLVTTIIVLNNIHAKNTKAEIVESDRTRAINAALQSTTQNNFTYFEYGVRLGWAIGNLDGTAKDAEGLIQACRTNNTQEVFRWFKAHEVKTNQ